MDVGRCFLCPKPHTHGDFSAQMETFLVAKRQGQFHHWEPIFIGTHADPIYDERLTWEGKKDKMTQVHVCISCMDGV